jgi:ankyrin repeat protein
VRRRADRKGAAMQTEPAPVFFLALRDGDTVTVRKMLSTADTQSWIDYQSDLGYTPLYIAALLNQPSITEQLIVARCNIDLHREDGATPLIIAAANGYETVTKQLLEARCNVDLQLQDGESALYNAAANGHAVVTKQLIEARCNINLQMQDGTTSLKTVLPGCVHSNSRTRSSQ